MDIEDVEMTNRREEGGRNDEDPEAGASPPSQDLGGVWDGFMLQLQCRL
jgi:hypothetical protein